jgi:hypothetical protein
MPLERAGTRPATANPVLDGSDQTEPIDDGT